MTANAHQIYAPDTFRTLGTETVALVNAANSVLGRELLAARIAELYPESLNSLTETARAVAGVIQHLDKLPPVEAINKIAEFCLSFQVATLSLAFFDTTQDQLSRLNCYSRLSVAKRLISKECMDVIDDIIRPLPHDFSRQDLHYLGEVYMYFMGGRKPSCDDATALIEYSEIKDFFLDMAAAFEQIKRDREQLTSFAFVIAPAPDAVPGTPALVVSGFALVTQTESPLSLIRISFQQFADAALTDLEDVTPDRSITLGDLVVYIEDPQLAEIMLAQGLKDVRIDSIEIAALTTGDRILTDY